MDLDASDVAKSSHDEYVKVYANIRPLISSELLLGSTDCVVVLPNRPQTGSGKSYTMGTNVIGEGNSTGIIPQVIKRIFQKVDEMKKDIEFLIKVTFIEVYMERLVDLLELHANAASRIDSYTSLEKPPRTKIQIRDTVNGYITLFGVTEAEVRSQEDMTLYLSRGSQSHATRSTNMNNHSSHLHAIFTICLEQKKSAYCNRDGSVNNDLGDDILVAKLHLVDLAGSERVKRTGAIGQCLEEACITPADVNAEETIDTLKYANRARNIKNKAKIRQWYDGN